MKNDPLGFFLTWTCYGTWLPGDQRGWSNWHRGWVVPQPKLESWARERLAEQALSLDSCQREIVSRTVMHHCHIRQWSLHAVDCRTNHVHVVVTALGYSGTKVRDEFKAWSTRRLKERQSATTSNVRDRWWTKGGSVRFLFDEDALVAAIEYVKESQDKGGSKVSRS